MSLFPVCLGVTKNGLKVFLHSVLKLLWSVYSCMQWVTDVENKKRYYYFGAARNLPGVKELLATQAEYEAEKRKTTSAELYRRIDADYYGYRDEDDGILVSDCAMVFVFRLLARGLVALSFSSFELSF